MLYWLGGHFRQLGGGHQHLLISCGHTGTIAVVRTTCTTEVCHAGNNDCEEHHRADYSAGSAGSSQT